MIDNGSPLGGLCRFWTMPDCILSVDIGTTSLKAALITETGKVLAFKRLLVPSKPVASVPALLDASVWSGLLADAVASFKQSVPEAFVEAVCVSGNGPSLCSAGGSAFLWNTKIPSGVSENVYAGKSLYIPRLLAYKELFPKLWEETPFLLGSPEYLIYSLTGIPVTILPEERFVPAYWTETELLGAGFSKTDVRKLPDFVAPASLAGKVSREGALNTGLSEGTCVFCGAPDFVVALLGTGTVVPGTVCDRAGSSEGINFCTAVPVKGENIRTLPSVVSGLWNASVLIPVSGARKDSAPKALLQEFAAAIDSLRAAAVNAGETFPDSVFMAGGQCLDENWVQSKADAASVNIKLSNCPDAELIGDAILALFGMKKFSTLQEAASAIVKTEKIFKPNASKAF